jgi:Zn-dependent metalloprotease
MLKQFPEVEAVVVGENGTPSFLRGDFSKGNSYGVDGRSLQKTLTHIAPLFGLNVPDLLLRHDEVDGLSYRHVYYDIELKGLPVVGAGIFLHFDPEGKLTSANGTVPDEVRTLPDSPKVDLASARSGMMARRTGENIRIKNGRLTWFRNPSDGKLTLAWELPISVDPAGLQFFEKAYVSAEDGRLIKSFSKVRHANRQIRDAQG